MTSHNHIIADPGDYPSNIGESMKRLAAKQTRRVELNSVTARICEQPEQFKWSSYRAKPGLIKAVWVDYDSWFRSLGTTIHNCRKRYTSLVKNTSAANKAASIYSKCR